MIKSLHISPEAEKLLDLSQKQSNIYDYPEDSHAGSSPLSASQLELIGAKEAGKILGINATTVYILWKQGLLDYWQIHGTKKTNLAAIIKFLEQTKNTELVLEKSDSKMQTN